MSSEDVRLHEEALIRELFGQGLSIRQMAKRSGFSRPKVDRIMAPIGADNGHRSPIAYLEQPVPERDDDDTAARVSAMDDGRGSDDFTPPFTMVGAEWVQWTNKGDDHAKTSLGDIFNTCGSASFKRPPIQRFLARRVMCRV